MYISQTVKRTPIAAYVDTGAQVTVISASAARRAGILHLMDRRYAGRATGVGHCKVLGRIPARHVYFFLGGDGGLLCRQGGKEEEQGELVQMDSPALTVLEGTVTKGVDMLLGLDVLQDWDAEIRMGKNKSITVRKKEGKSKHANSVVIPFVSQRDGRRQSNAADPRAHAHDKHSRIINHQSKARQHSRQKLPNKTSAMLSHQSRHLPQSNSMTSQFQNRNYETAIYQDVDEDFSPTASDVESDLDLLESSRHQQEDLDEEIDNEILPRQFDNSSDQDELEDPDDDYLDDVDDGDVDKAHFDMSGL